MNDSRLLRVLRKVEWVTHEDQTGIGADCDICPDCGVIWVDSDAVMGLDKEHATDCELQAEINAEEMRLEYLRSKAEPC